MEQNCLVVKVKTSHSKSPYKNGNMVLWMNLPALDALAEAEIYRFSE